MTTTRTTITIEIEGALDVLQGDGFMDMSFEVGIAQQRFRARLTSYKARHNVDPRSGYSGAGEVDAIAIQVKED